MDRRTAIVATIGAVVVIGAVVLVAVLGGDGEPAPDETIAEPVETVPATPPDETEDVVDDDAPTGVEADDPTEPVATDPTAPNATVATAQTFIVGPQQPITTEPGDPASAGGEGVTQFTVVGTYDGEPLPDDLQLSWVPCDGAEPVDQPVTFADADEDGLADDLGDSETGAAVLRFVNGDTPPESEDSGVWTVPIVDGQLTFAFESFEPDCLVPVVFEDEDADAALDLGDGGVPEEPFGVGQVEWT